ncbi:hypothetical protein HDU98_000352 [Podochytrium sp. JEL0797]|nr:hypothetical protein HDU98_000352 [Podochytrium sp. JEL0797]
MLAAALGPPRNSPDLPYSIVSHVWGATVKGITHMWNVEMPQVIEVNRNPAKHAALHWLYSRKERVWMDIFNTNQHDKRVQSAQVAVMDILYARAERCYIVLECNQAATNLNKLLDSVPRRNQTESTLLEENGSAWGIRHVLVDCGNGGDEEWERCLNVLLDKTEYRGRVWTMQEEMVSHDKVVILANAENDLVYFVSHKPLPDVACDSRLVTTQKLSECSELYKKALKYRKSGDIGYSIESFKTLVHQNMLDYKRECFRAVDHVFAVNRLVGITMETDYHDDPDKILQEWQYKLLKAGLLSLPFATHQPYRSLKTDSCWKLLYWVPSCNACQAVFETEDKGHEAKTPLHIEHVGPAVPAKDNAVVLSHSMHQGAVFNQAYYDSSYLNAGRKFDLKARFAPNGRDMIVYEVDSPLMEQRSDSGVSMDGEKVFVVLKDSWTHVVHEREIESGLTFYKQDSFEMVTRGLIELQLNLETGNGVSWLWLVVLTAVDCEKTTVDQSLKQVSLEPLRTHLAKHLSGGEKRRLSIAIALVGDPAVVFLDEPTTGLDPENIIQTARKDKTIILTTHSMEEAEALCQRIGIMAKGSLRCIGPPLRLKELYGKGFKISFYSLAEDTDRACAFVESILPVGSKKVDAFVTNTAYEFPGTSHALSGLFEQMERGKGENGILEWGVCQTTLEDVFLKLISEDDASAK